MDRRTSRLVMYGGLALIVAVVVLVVIFSPR
jgi:predicted nucleic acid-binding Zn ribbon protein